MRSIRVSIADAKSDILVLMQDTQEVDAEWAEEMWLAVEMCTLADEALDRVELHT